MKVKRNRVGEGGVRVLKRAAASGTLATLDGLQVHQVFRLGPSSMVLPHLQVELLQVHGVLLCVEEGAADTLFPHTSSDHLQTMEKVRGLIKNQTAFFNLNAGPGQMS